MAVSPPAAAAHSDMNLAAAAAAMAEADPDWLPRFILTPFYDACPVHSPRHRSERNRYDVATGAKLCQYCAAERTRSGGGDGRPLIQLCRVRAGRVYNGILVVVFVVILSIAGQALWFSSMERVC